MTVNAELFQCDGDAAAIEKVKELPDVSNIARMEVWQGTRKVGVVERG